jgi:hypothetical protein
VITWPGTVSFESGSILYGKMSLFWTRSMDWKLKIIFIQFIRFRDGLQLILFSFSGADTIV